uniref:chloroplast protein-transporting ATPase n=1 Tax=Lactuca sativa TaxID=4236 RepID=A0A9R1XWD7_LACSA|nr:hypothetical protein LSAT_V11C200052750 [Lactuca sativa]
MGELTKLCAYSFSFWFQKRNAELANGSRKGMDGWDTHGTKEIGTTQVTMGRDSTVTTSHHNTSPEPPPHCLRNSPEPPLYHHCCLFHLRSRPISKGLVPGGDMELTEEGIALAEMALETKDLWDENDPWARFVMNALKAKEFYRQDVQYIVKNGKALIINELTGRVEEKRRWSEGIHQDVEAKEVLPIQADSIVVAQITYQSMFKLYPKLSGMTGTAKTEHPTFIAFYHTSILFKKDIFHKALYFENYTTYGYLSRLMMHCQYLQEKEFLKMFQMPVIEVPTNMANIRHDLPIQAFANARGKWEYVHAEVESMSRVGRHVLVGTTRVENSEYLSALLRASKIPHNVLNARPKYAAREAQTVSQAGRKYAITISTNMAGRGTDIILGGNPKMLAKDVIEDNILSHMSHDTPDVEVEDPNSQKVAILSFGPNVNVNGIWFWVNNAAKYVGKSENKSWTYEKAKSIISESIEMSQSMGLDELQRLVEEQAEMYPLGPCIAIAYLSVLKDCEIHCFHEGLEVKRLGGLHVIGTSLHESRRIDNQKASWQSRKARRSWINTLHGQVSSKFMQRRKKIEFFEDVADEKDKSSLGCC